MELEGGWVWRRAGQCEKRRKTAVGHTLYFRNKSFLSGALIRTLRSTEVAPKCAFRIFRREDVLLLFNFTIFVGIFGKGGRCRVRKCDKNDECSSDHRAICV